MAEAPSQLTTDAITRLGKRVAERWKDHGLNHAVLPVLATCALETLESFSAADIIRCIMHSEVVPPQRRMDNGFGQPCVTLYRDDVVEIELLFWSTGSPSIHHHAFSGAFKVIHGRSLHCSFSFKQRTSLGSILFGDLVLEDAAILAAGSCCPIPIGASLIHSTFHLDDPSVTLVIRSRIGNVPEYAYIGTSVALDVNAGTETLRKKLQLIKAFRSLDSTLYWSELLRWLDSASLYDVFMILLSLPPQKPGLTFLPELLSLVAKRYPDYYSVLIDSVTDYASSQQITQRRYLQKDPGERLSLAFDLFRRIPRSATGNERWHQVIASTV